MPESEQRGNIAEGSTLRSQENFRLDILIFTYPTHSQPQLHFSFSMAINICMLNSTENQISPIMSEEQVETEDGLPPCSLYHFSAHFKQRQSGYNFRK